MEQYIPKNALVAEIEKLNYIIMPYLTMAEKVAYRDGIRDAINILIKFPEVREVDLNREIRCYRMRNPIIQHREESLYDYIANVAKYFFGLGLIKHKRFNKSISE